MKHLKQASVAALLTLILSVWLFCYQLHTEGVGITVTSRLQENGLLVGLAVVIVFLFQLFQDQIGGGIAAFKEQLPTLALPTTHSNPKLYRTLQLCLLVATNMATSKHSCKVRYSFGLEWVVGNANVGSCSLNAAIPPPI